MKLQNMQTELAILQATNISRIYVTLGQQGADLQKCAQAIHESYVLCTARIVALAGEVEVVVQPPYPKKLPERTYR